MQNFHTVKDLIFSLTGCTYAGEINFVNSEGVYAEYDGTSAKIGGCDTAAVCPRADRVFRTLFKGREHLLHQAGACFPALRRYAGSQP